MDKSHFADDILKHVFLGENHYIFKKVILQQFLPIHNKFVPKGPTDNEAALV